MFLSKSRRACGSREDVLSLAFYSNSPPFSLFERPRKTGGKKKISVCRVFLSCGERCSETKRCTVISIGNQCEEWEFHAILSTREREKEIWNNGERKELSCTLVIALVMGKGWCLFDVVSCVFRLLRTTRESSSSPRAREKKKITATSSMSSV